MVVISVQCLLLSAGLLLECLTTWEIGKWTGTGWFTRQDESTGPILMLCEVGKLHGVVSGKETARTRLGSTPSPSTKTVKLSEVTVQNICQKL